MDFAGRKTIGVLVAEDNDDLCAAVCELIGAEPGMHVTGSVRRAGELLEVLHTTSAQVLVLDLDLDGESSMPALQALRGSRPGIAVVVYSGHERGALASAFSEIEHCEYVTK
jgi:DNA-binding NarL/FixJ family response regulator